MRAKTTIITAAMLLLASLSAEATLAAHNAVEATLKLDGAVNTLQLEYGRYPSQREGLSALTKGPTDIPQTNFIGYIKTLEKDWWGRDYVYRFAGIHNPGSFDLYSLGEDGVSKTGGNDRDNINSWNQQSPWRAYYARWRPIDTLMERLSATYYAVAEAGLSGLLMLGGIACAVACVLWRRKKLISC